MKLPGGDVSWISYVRGPGERIPLSSFFFFTPGRTLGNVLPNLKTIKNHCI